MMGAYSIRRLIDSEKSSSQLPSKRVRTRRYNLSGRKPMALDRFDPERFYDLNKPSKTELDVTKLCNQIIHSFVFQIYLEEDLTTSVLFNSDRDRDKHLHGITFHSLAGLFDYVGREDIIEHSGTMIDGVQRIINVSNHDLVESGRAAYIDEDRVFIERNYEEPPAFSEGALEMVMRRMAELKQTNAESAEAEPTAT